MILNFILRLRERCARDWDSDIRDIDLRLLLKHSSIEVLDLVRVLGCGIFPTHVL